LSARQEASDKILELPHWVLRSQRYKHRLTILRKACICPGVLCISMAEKSLSEEIKNRWISRPRAFEVFLFRGMIPLLTLCSCCGVSFPDHSWGLVPGAVLETAAAAPALKQ